MDAVPAFEGGVPAATSHERPLLGRSITAAAGSDRPMAVHHRCEFMAG
jgi:hypothetical protein